MKQDGSCPICPSISYMIHVGYHQQYSNLAGFISLEFDIFFFEEEGSNPATQFRLSSGAQCGTLHPIAKSSEEQVVEFEDPL